VFHIVREKSENLIYSFFVGWVEERDPTLINSNVGFPLFLNPTYDFQPIYI
jgi:hypothetical protein